MAAATSRLPILSLARALRSDLLSFPFRLTVP